MGMRGFAIVLLLALAQPAFSGTPSPDLERSYWVHASLGSLLQKGYMKADAKPAEMPRRQEVQNAARLLAGPYAANRLYLVYHHELPIDDARRVFTWWREALPAGVEIVPSLVLRMYDKQETPVWTPQEAAALADFFRKNINRDRIAVYDVYPDRDQGPALTELAARFPKGLLRVGVQPEEALPASVVEGVEDTWSGFCHGRRNVEDWQQPGFGAETLRRWVELRNRGRMPIAWDLIAVAWDYRPTRRGEFPGYDDAEKNEPLPPGRNRLAAELIRRTARAEVFAGFSSDLCILDANSRAAAHDGSAAGFYESLRQGREYDGYYAAPLKEIAAIYRELRDAAKRPN
ncbi:MAG: hypothetical protein ABFC96_15070 [Thermoguttaceae bacterium]